MAECVYCKSETELFYGGNPVCINCANERDDRNRKQSGGGDVRTILFQNLTEATLRAESASENFRAVMGEVPGTTPHPDGVQKIHNASHEMSNARDELMKAHHRLNSFIETGIVPDDLKGGKE